MFRRGSVTIRGYALKRGSHVVTVPIIRAGARKSVEKSVNAMLWQMIKTMLAGAGWSEPAIEISGGFIVHVNERGVLSLSQEVYALLPGETEGSTNRRSLTVDTLNGQRYELESLFHEGGHYLVDIKSIIKARGGQHLAFPIEHYYLTKESLVVYFPHPTAPIYYQIPYSLIARHINSTGPLRRLLDKSKE